MDGLRARGHNVTIANNGPLANAGFGRGQIIRRLENGAYLTGSEPRADGHQAERAVRAALQARVGGLEQRIGARRVDDAADAGMVGAAGARGGPPALPRAPIAQTLTRESLGGSMEQRKGLAVAQSDLTLRVIPDWMRALIGPPRF